MRIVPYEEKYRKAIENICLRTAAFPVKLKGICQYLLAVYCNYYLDHGIVYVLLDDHDFPQGYILCAPDYEQYKHEIKPYWEHIRFPYTFLSNAELESYLPYTQDYPAHLHIDIMEPYTGHGNGRKLMQTLLDDLRARGTRGIMLNVSAKNKRAIAFYKACCFTVVRESKAELTMVQKLF